MGRSHRVEAASHYVDPDIRKAESLAPEAFTSRAFLERELETLFARSWLLLPQVPGDTLRDDSRSLVERVRLNGARVPVSVLDKPLFLQRDRAGVLRAFPNVCTHAWHTLVAGPERDRSLVCPQHGRRFDTAGRYQTQPGMPADLPGFPRPCDHLRELKVHAWSELLWVCLGNPAGPPPLQTVQGLLGRLPMNDLQRLSVAGEVREVAGNWKQHACNYLDSLHIPFVHSRPGGLSDALHTDSYRTEVYDDAVLQWAYARDARLGFDPDLLPERFRDADGRRVFALWWFVWPNTTLNFYPWGLSVNTYAPVPGRPDRTLFHWYQWSWNQDAAKRMEDWHMQSVDDEDVAALREVARGLRSGMAVRGRFAPGAEDAPHWFHRRVYQELFDSPSEPSTNAPATCAPC